MSGIAFGSQFGYDVLRQTVNFKEAQKKNLVDPTGKERDYIDKTIASLDIAQSKMNNDSYKFAKVKEAEVHPLDLSGDIGLKLQTLAEAFLQKVNENKVDLKDKEYVSDAILYLTDVKNIEYDPDNFPEKVGTQLNIDDAKAAKTLQSKKQIKEKKPKEILTEEEQKIRYLKRLLASLCVGIAVLGGLTIKTAREDYISNVGAVSTLPRYPSTHINPVANINPNDGVVPIGSDKQYEINNSYNNDSPPQTKAIIPSIETLAYINETQDLAEQRGLRTEYDIPNARLEYKSRNGEVSATPEEIARYGKRYCGDQAFMVTDPVLTESTSRPSSSDLYCLTKD